MQLSDIIHTSSCAALAHQQADGSFPAGQNGPYADTDTPVRNTAHWLITLLRTHELSGEARFLDAAARAANYLTTDETRPMGASFLCRTNPERDFCNGLMGQAWAFEGLVAAADALDEPRFRQLARDVFLLHSFDKQAGLWHCLNVEGSYAPFDMTFNHQLWFAASGALIENDPKGEIGSKVVRFLDRTLASHLKVDPTGRVTHFVPSPRRKSVLRRSLSTVLQPIKRMRRSPKMVHKEIGYHAFNLYAFALLKHRMPSHPLWKSEKIQAALRFVKRPDYLQGLENNGFGYAYNPPGFEVAYAMQTFGEARDDGRPDHWWVSQQLKRTYNPDTHMLDRNTKDPVTLSARLYEAARLRDVEVSL